jgi:hypothetical protein
VLGYDGQTWLSPSQAKPDTGVVDFSQQTIAAPIMAVPVIAGAPALLAGLTIPAAATGGATIIGTVPADGVTDVALAIMNDSPTASLFVLDFSEGLSATQLAAARAFIYQQALMVLNQVYTSGVVPPNWLNNGNPATLQDVENWYNLIFDALQNNMWKYGTNPAPPHNSVASNPGNGTDLGTAIAEASIDGGGAASGVTMDGGGGSGGNVYDGGDGLLGYTGGGCSVGSNMDGGGNI